MDFARPHVVVESPVSRSNIVASSSALPGRNAHQQDISKEEEDPLTSDLDTMAGEAANKAAIELFLGPPPPPLGDLGSLQQMERRVDAKNYQESILPPQSVIQQGDLVVIMISFDNLTFVYAKHKSIFSNRHGHFHHDDFIGKPYGCKIRSRNNRGFGFCYLLKPTPELWTRSLNHRTQIVHELDQSQIVHQLWLRPNLTVVESGTGSAALSHSLLRAIAPFGHLHTYEFHKQRAETARAELEQHTSPSMVTVHHKDVCGKTSTEGEDETDAAKGGFDLPGQSVDAVFLDLPEPWLAIPHAAFVLKPNARIASYSPCVEQAQRAIQALRAAGFHSIQTMEYRLQEHYVDDVSYKSPPRSKRRRIQKHVHEESCQAESDDKKNEDNGPTTEDDEAYAKDEPCDGNGKSGSEVSKPNHVSDEKEVPREDGSKGNTPKLDIVSKMLVARPFTMMRGHTAFLTFATSPRVPQTDPNEASQATKEEK